MKSVRAQDTRHKSTSLKIIAVLAVVLMSFATSAQASVMIFGDGPLGDFEGSLSYHATNATTSTLIITLKNISPIANGGYLTAFVFNNPDNLIRGVALSCTDPDFDILGGASFNNRINAAPYGKFDIGASISSAFEGGGKPREGMAVNATETFAFDFTGSGLDTLDEQSFVSELSEGKGAGEGYEFFLARFRGFNDGGSNHTPGTVTPEPASLSLLGLGLIAFLKIGGKRRNK